jgi:hypothetical protein
VARKDPHRLREDAANAVARGKHAVALELYTELEQLEPAAPLWPKRIGEAHRRLGDMAGAIAAFERAIDKYVADGLLVQAIGVCKMILQIAPTNVHAATRLAELAMPRPAELRAVQAARAKAAPVARIEVTPAPRGDDAAADPRIDAARRNLAAPEERGVPRAAPREVRRAKAVTLPPGGALDTVPLADIMPDSVRIPRDDGSDSGVTFIAIEVSLDEISDGVDDPKRAARRRRIIAIAGVATAAAAIAGLATARLVDAPKKDPCAGARERLAGVWDAPRRAALVRAFAATGVSYAADTVARVDKALDAYGDAWVAMHDETCRAPARSADDVPRRAPASARRAGRRPRARRREHDAPRDRRGAAAAAARGVRRYREAVGGDAASNGPGRARGVSRSSRRCSTRRARESTPAASASRTPCSAMSSRARRPSATRRSRRRCCSSSGRSRRASRTSRRHRSCCTTRCSPPRPPAIAS